MIVSCESLREQAAKPTFFNLTAVVGSHLKNKNSVHSSTCPLQALTSVRIFKFKRLLHVASGFGVLDHKEEADAMQVRLGKLFPRLDAEWLHVAATTISSYLLADFSWITAALQNDRETFEIFAKCRLQVPMSSPLSKKQHDQIKEFYFLLQTVFIPALKEVRDNIPVSSEQFWCSLGVEFTKDTKLENLKIPPISRTANVKVIGRQKHDVLTSSTIAEFQNLTFVAKNFKILRPSQEHSAMQDRLAKLLPHLSSE